MSVTWAAFIRILVVMTALLAIPHAVFASGISRATRKCGVAFVLPAKWTAAEKRSHDYPAETNIECQVLLRPAGWTALARKSRWGAADPPVVLMIFASDTSYEDALDEVGFENDENGHGFGVPGGLGFGEAEPYVAGRFSGLVAHTYFRGFIRDDSLLHKDESRVFGGEIVNVVMKAPSGRIIAFRCWGSTPDERIDCDAAIKGAGGTLTFEHAKQ